MYRTSGADTCTVKRNGYEGHVRHRLHLNCQTEPKDPGQQAPSPTCPFIKTNNVKDRKPTNIADDQTPPDPKPGNMVIPPMSATNQASSENRQAPSVKGPL